MAVFNPQVPQSQDPNYLGYSHPISEPEVDKSKAIAIKGVGDVLEEGIKGIDTTMKIHTENLGENLGKTESEDFLTAVNYLKDNLLGKTEDNVPGPVKDGVEGFNKLQNGREHMSELEYRKNLYLKAKDLRSAYPGYRDYIDKGVEKATGITPNANQYITALIADINRNLEGKNKFADKAISAAYQAMESGAPGMADHIDAYQQGRMSLSELNHKTNEANAFKYTDAVRSAKLRGFEGDIKLQAQEAKDVIAQHVSGATQQTLDGIFVQLGLTGDKLTEAMAKHARGEDINIGDDAWVRAGQLTKSAEIQLRRQFDTKFSEKDENGRSVIQKAGSDYNTTINENMRQLHQVQEAITNKDIGLMFTNKALGEAIQHNDVIKALQSPTIGPIIRLAGAAHKTGGDNLVTKFLTAWFGSDKMPGTKDVETLTKNMMTNEKYNGVDGINKAYDVTSDVPGPKGIKIRGAVVQAPAVVIPSPEVDDPTKLNSINYTFAPKEQGLLGRIENDGQTVDGKPIRGRQSVFAEYSKPAMVSEVKRLGETYGTEYSKNYKEWMETAFTQDLFGRDLGTLREMQEWPGLTVKWINDKGQKPRFELELEGKTANLTDPYLSYPHWEREKQNRLKVLSASVNRLNAGISGLDNVYTGLGGGENMNTRMLQILQDSGINMQKAMNAIVSTRKPEPKKEIPNYAGSR